MAGDDNVAQKNYWDTVSNIAVRGHLWMDMITALSMGWTREQRTFVH